MFYSLAIPGILPAWPVGDQLPTQEEIEQRKALLPVSRRNEGTYTGMTTKKSSDSQGTDAAPYSTSNQEEYSYSVTQLYEQFRRQIHSYIYRLLGNREDADDVTQEVFVRAFSAWDHLYERDNLSAWLYRIATNLCVDALRRRKRISWWPLARRGHMNEFAESNVDEENSYLPPDSGGIPEVAERDHIRLALANMPEEYAVVLVLSAAQGVPYKEIAIILGVSPNAAATRISRAKKMFAVEYQRISNADVEGQEERR